MSHRSSGTITLLNPIRNEVEKYSVFIPRYYTLRTAMLQEILLWNTNCFLCKLDPKPQVCSSTAAVGFESFQPFLLVCRTRFADTKTRGVCVLRFQAPTKMDVLFAGYTGQPIVVAAAVEEEEEAKPPKKTTATRSEKLNAQGEKTAEDLEQEVKRTCRFMNVPILEINVSPPPSGEAQNVMMQRTDWRWSHPDKTRSFPQDVFNKTIREYHDLMKYENTEANDRAIHPDWEDHFVLGMMFACFLRPYIH
jgi:hypothetical protein